MRESVREDSQSVAYSSDEGESNEGEGRERVGGWGRGGGGDNAADEGQQGLSLTQGLLRICTSLYRVTVYRVLMRIFSFRSPYHVGFGEHKFSKVLCMVALYSKVQILKSLVYSDFIQ